MGSRNNSHWLTLRKSRAGVGIEKTDRLWDIIHDLDAKPSLVLLIGETAKKAALRCMVPSLQKAGGPNNIDIRLDADSLCTDRPLLFADGPCRVHESSTVDSISTGAIDWLEGRLETAVHAVYSRLLSPFLDVVCLFLSDFSGMSELVSFVSAWIKSASISPSLVLPRLAVITEESTFEPAQWKRIFFHQLRKTEKPFGAVFAGLAVHCLDSAGSASNKIRYEKLKDFLLQEADLVSSCRAQRHLHFHARHLAALFDEAYLRFLDNTEFEYIASSRAERPVPHGAAHHVSFFVKDFREPEKLSSFVLPMVASAFMLDAFPRGRHGTF